MTARRLEEFISLIETAEKISARREGPHTSRTVPSLKLSSLASPSPSLSNRFTGPAASHCGLTLSDTSRRVTASDTTRNVLQDSFWDQSEKESESIFVLFTF